MNLTIATGSVSDGFAVIALVGVAVVLGFSWLWARWARSGDDEAVLEARQGVVAGVSVIAFGLFFATLL